MEHHTPIDADDGDEQLRRRGIEAALILLWLLRSGRKRAKKKLKQITDASIASIVRSREYGQFWRSGVFSSIQQNGLVLSREVAQELKDLKAEARAAARRELEKQIERVKEIAGKAGVPTDNVEVTPSLPDANTIDAATTDAAGKNIGGKWVSITTAVVVSGNEDKPEKAPDVAEQSVQPALDRVVETEIAHVFNDELLGQIDQLAEELAGTPLGELLYKRWESALEANTCSTCSHMHNTVVHISEPFPGKLVPSHVHPRCKCEAVIFVPNNLLELARQISSEGYSGAEWVARFRAAKRKL